MNVEMLNFNFLPGSEWPSEVISRFEALSYEQCEQMSVCIGKTISSSRGILNMLGYSFFLEGTNLSSWMITTAKKAKIFSGLSIPFSAFKAKAALAKTTKSIAIDDGEGALINSLGLAATSAGTLDSVGTFTNAFRNVIMGKGPISLFADMTLPIGFFVSGIDITSRSFQLSKASKLYQEIDPSIFLKEEAVSMDHLRRKLQRRLGIRQEAKSLKRLASASQGSPQTLEDRKIAKLKRVVPEKTQEDVNKLFDYLSTREKQPLTAKERKEVATSLQKIRLGLEKKMAEDTILMVGAFVGVVALVFFCMNGMGALPYAVQMVASTIKAYSSVCVENLFNVSPDSLIGQGSLNFTH